MLLPEGDEHRLQRLELGQFLPAHDLDDRLPLPLPLVAGKGRRVGRGGDATPGSVFESGPYFVVVPTPSRPSRGQRRTLAQVALPYICRLIPQNEPVDIAFDDAAAW
jgi:hypothetical protein